MTDQERIRALELDNARLGGEVAGLRAVLEVMRHLLPSAAPGIPTTVVPMPGPWEYTRSDSGKGGTS